MTVSEAAACATPAVVSRIAGHVDAVEDGVSGIVVPLPAAVPGGPADRGAAGTAMFADALRIVLVDPRYGASGGGGAPAGRRAHVGGHRGRDPRRPRRRGRRREEPAQVTRCSPSG